MSVYMSLAEPGSPADLNQDNQLLVGNMTLTTPHPNKDEIMTKYHI